MSQAAPASENRSTIAFMLLSAAIFGYCGFLTTWIHTSSITGKVLPFVVMLDYTLKAAAIAFVISAVVTMARPQLGNLLYSVVGLISAIMFVVIAIMDYLDKQHTAMDPLILILFAAWNGFGSWSGIKEFSAAMRRANQNREQIFGAGGS